MDIVNHLTLLQTDTREVKDVELFYLRGYPMQFGMKMKYLQLSGQRELTRMVRVMG